MGLLKRRRRSRAVFAGASCIVEALESRSLLSVFAVTNTGDNGGVNPAPGAGTGTLRQAIIDSNASNPTGTNTIDFDIPGSGVQTIEPLTPLPAILEPTTIEGYSQSGSSPNTLGTADNAIIEVDISGAVVGANGVGLTISGAAASGSTIEGLAINGFANGLQIINGANGNTISGNFIGTDATGTIGLGNSTNGIYVDTANNFIGGPSPAAANLISGNAVDCIVFDQATATGNTIQGNDIGLNAPGTSALGNALAGVVIGDGASNNTIGGTAVGDGNVITASGQDGVLIVSNSGQPSSTGNTVVGNSIYGNSQLGTYWLGIDLTDYPAKPVAGNNDEPSPNLTSASYQSGNLTITGSFQGTGSGTLLLDLYTSNNLDASGAGEGQTYLGRFTVNNGSGTVSLGSIDVPGTFSLGQWITGTLTDSAGNTSDFSNAVEAIPAGQTSFVVTNTNDSGAGSLREAIIEADHNVAEPNVIDFDIPGSGVQTIEPLTPLPLFTEPTTIDGYSQPGASPNTLTVGDNAVILIDLNGSNVAAGYEGLELDASNSVIRGLAIGGFQGVPDPTHPTDPGYDTGGEAITTDPGMTNITIAGNFIGTDASGNTAVANVRGIDEYSSGDTIGGLAPADRNIISGNSSLGIVSSAANTVIEGNYIGTDTSGLKSLTGNVDDGVVLSQELDSGATSTSVQLGGSTVAARNVIVSTNYCVSIFDGAHDETVQGNYIGINATATATFSNVDGVYIDNASDNTIGGPNAGDANVIGGAVGTAGIGVFREVNNTIGPDSTGNVIQGNWIGISPTSTALPNFVGITFQGTSNNTVGGTAAGAGNIIADNTGDGVDVGGTNTSGGNSLTTAADDTIVGNSIYNNTGLGIDLLAGPDEIQGGITPQTPGIHNSGSNNLQNFPNITSANIVNGQLQISGNFLSDTPAGSSLTLDVYVSNTFGYDGYGPGQTYVGETTLTSGSGTVNFGPLNFSGGALGQFVTATLTDSSGNTSEFSNALYIGDPFVVTNTNDSGFGSLRQAIINADTFPDNPGTDLIHFDIPGSGVQKITLESPLPDITHAVTIDGYTQPGSSPNTLTTGDNAVIEVELDGASAGAASGLVLAGAGASGSIIAGLDVNQFAAAGIQTAVGATGITIIGNFIGTDPTGTLNLGNGEDGIFLFTANNRVGGPSPAAANLISGNTYSGVKIYQTSATGNIIQGNYIGSNAAATSALGNGLDGVTISDGASSNTVGGTAAGDGNVITGNGADGVYMNDDSGTPYPVDNTIVGNSMYLNTGLGIQLSGYIVFGINPYFLQNIPFLTDAIYQNGTLTINGEFPGSGSGTLLLDLYVSNAADPSGFVEGKTYLGEVTVNNGTGFVSLGSIDVTGPFTVGQLITATLTNPAGETSEFSNPAEVSAFDTNPLVVTNTNDSGNGSLRAAILYANANPIAGGAPNVISFDIPGSGVQTITPLTPLPDLTEPVTIDGYTQPGASQNTLTTGDNANILIQISDADLLDSTSTDLLALDTSNALIRGLILNVSTGLGNAIHILPNYTNDVIAGNFIYGFEPATTTYVEAQYGVFIDSAPGNIVGGTTPADRNVISENGTGVYVSGAGATGNVVEGDYIGTTPALTLTDGQAIGVDLESPGNTIGGTSPGARNIITGNSIGIYLNPSGTTGDLRVYASQ